MTRSHTAFMLLLLLSMARATMGQSVFSGRVVDQRTKEVLSWVSVVGEDKNHRPIAFTQTKDDGSFVLKVPEGKSTYRLTISLMGYAKSTIATADFKNGQTVAIRQEALQLKNVEVKSKRLLRKGDTLSYSVAGFRQKQDRSIADVIAKMPGLEVTDNGMIKFHGKPINKFYVEGMDLMGRQYAMASENLNAKKVKEVQVLTNHQEVKALRGVQFSDRAAVNLVLEEDAKNTWTGLLEMGGGTTLQSTDADRLLRDGRLMGMMFGGKKQSLSLYKWNNTGKDIRNEVRDLTDNSNESYDPAAMTTDVQMSYRPDLDQERHLLNDSRIGATNWLWKTGKESSLRLQLSGYIDSSEGYHQQETTYSDALGGAVVIEDEQGLYRDSRWKGEVKYEQNSNQLFISNVVGGHLDVKKNHADTRLNQATTRQESDVKKWLLDDHLQVVKTLSHDRAFRLNVSAGYCFQPNMLLLRDGTAQHIDQHAAGASASTSYRHRLFRRLNVTYQAGIDYQEQRFSLHRDRQQPLPDNYRQFRGYLQPMVSLKHKSLKWSMSVPLSIIHQQLGQQHQTRLVAEPSTTIEYQLTGMLTARASYRYGWRPASLAAMTSVPIYTSYLRYTTGPGELLVTKTHTGSLRMEYANPVAGVFGHLDGTLTFSPNVPLYSSRLDGPVYRSEATGGSSDRRTWLINGRISKSLGAMKFLAALNGQLMRSYSTVVMSRTAWPFRYDSYQLSVNFSLRPLTCLSVEEKSSYQYARQVSTANHALDSRPLRSFHHRLKLFLFIKNWQVEWANDIYHSNDHTVSFCHFSDLHLSYRTKKYEAGISLNNIIGSNSYERHYVTANATVFAVSSLRPREILAKVCIDL